LTAVVPTVDHPVPVHVVGAVADGPKTENVIVPVAALVAADSAALGVTVVFGAATVGAVAEVPDVAWTARTNEVVCVKVVLLEVAPVPVMVIG
jgi:hypothetical protein